MRRLNNSTVPTLPRKVGTPSYERSRITPGVVHLGVGAFHRAHQAPLLDDCLARGENAWGIVAASLRSAGTRDALMPQDCLYTLATRDGGPQKLRVIGSIADVLVGPEDPQALLATLADPRIRIVTLTVTEKGYTANLATRELRRDHPDVIHDVANPSRPRSALGFLTEALRERRQQGTPAFTVLSCDNIPANGKTLKALLVQFASLRDRDLASYVEASVSCPCCMIDRIVPATTDRDRSEVSGALGVADAWPVVAEPFWQWVVEDAFPLGRPCLELSGVEFVEDVEPYENMKIRLLNGPHTAIAAIGRAAGLATVADVYADDRVRRFVDAYWRQAAGTLPAFLDTRTYTADLSRRFSNTALQHRTEQIAMDASQKLPQRIIAPMSDLTDRGRDRSLLLFAVAAWIRSCMPTSERAEAIVLNDPCASELAAAVRAGGSEAVTRAVFGISAIFGERWQADDAAQADVKTFLDLILDTGVLQAAETVAARPSA